MKKRRKKNGKTKKKKSKVLLSLCMIVKNEEDNLGRCLESAASYFDQIVVVDTGSTDRTVKIAESFGAEVHHFRWIDDFSAARNVSLKHAKGKYIVWLDADDVLPPGSGDLIRETAKSGKFGAYFLILKNIKADLSETRMFQLRMFPNIPGIRFENPIHEQAIFSVNRLKLPILTLNAEIHHWGYHDNKAMRNKHLRVLRILSGQLKKHPDNFQYQYYYGLSSMGIDKFDDATAAFDAVIASEKARIDRPDIVQHSFILKGRILEKKGKPSEAEKVYRNLLREFPKFFLGHYTLGEILYSAGRFEEATEHFRKVIEVEISIPLISIPVDSVRFISYYRLASLAEKRKNYDEAIIMLKHSLGLMPRELKPLISLANLYFMLGRMDEADAIYDKLIKVDPDKPDWLLRKGICLVKKGNKEDALNILAGALRKFPDFPPALITYAKLLVMMNRHEEALPHAEKALTLQKKNIGLYKLTAEINWNTGRFTTAIDRFEHYLNKMPDDYQAMTGLAYCYYETGAFESARLGFLAVLALQPEYPPALHGLEKIGQIEKITSSA